jgi:hypothetical protein
VATDWDTVARVNAIEKRVANIRRETTLADVDAMAATQSRADSVLAHFGQRASPPIPGERHSEYRKRMLATLAPYSSEFKSSRFGSLDDATLPVIEDRVYQDAAAAARADADKTPGVLIPFEERDCTGRLITKYRGDIGAFLAPFVLDGVSGRINRNP